MQSEPITQSSSIKPSSRIGPAFWFILGGGLFGVLLGVYSLAGSVAESLGLALLIGSTTQLTLAYVAGSIGIIVFSIIGLIAGSEISQEKVPSPLLVILASVGIATNCFWGLWVALFPALLFFVGGALIWHKLDTI
jgi:hypothetical protein